METKVPKVRNREVKIIQLYFFFRKDEIEGLKVMLRNRLDEIEIWKQRCYKLEGQRINNEDSI